MELSEEVKSIREKLAADFEGANFKRPYHMSARGFFKAGFDAGYQQAVEDMKQQIERLKPELD